MWATERTLKAAARPTNLRWVVADDDEVELRYYHLQQIELMGAAEQQRWDPNEVRPPVAKGKKIAVAAA